MRYLSAFVCSLVMLCFNTQASAQLDSCNAFLQGHHLEVGISPAGSYGSCVPPPTGYHPHCSSCRPTAYNPCAAPPSASDKLGFVADYDDNGWLIGAPCFMGDYIQPGVPFEGWELQVGSNLVRVTNLDTPGFTGTITGTGSNLSVDITVDSVSSVFQGIFDSIQITQKTMFDSGALYFATQVTLTNLASSPAHDVYYFRSVDPDNDETWPGGSANTYNYIAHQSLDTTMVTATGPMGAYTIMALGTTMPNARCLIYNDWPVPVTTDIAAMYNETYVPADYTPFTYDNGDFAIGLVFSIPYLSSVDSAGDSVYRTTSLYTRHPANSATFFFFYAFGTTGIDSALSQLASTSYTLGATSIVNVNAGISVYPNPSSRYVCVSSLSAGDRVDIYDMMGRQVATRQAANAGTETLQTGSLLPGNYIITVTCSDGTIRARSVMQKM